MNLTDIKLHISQLIGRNKIRTYVHQLIKVSKYRFYGKKTEPKVIYFIDGSNYGGGLTDRLRQIMGMYTICKSKGYKFGLIANHPFELSDYLKPNYDWLESTSELSRNIFHTKPIYLGFRSRDEYLSLIHLKKRQLHLWGSVHWGWFDEFGYRMDEIFWELFKPNPIITELINKYKSQYHSWDCIVFRFQNLLGDFNEHQSANYGNVKLNHNQQQELVDICLKYVKNRTSDSKHFTLVCADSHTFLEIVKNLPNVFVIPGKLTHMEYSASNDFNLHLKSFVDFFMISESDSVESVGTEIMYPTDFPVMAAAIRNKPFKRVLLNSNEK